MEKETDMNLSKQLATHLREVFFGGNWTAVNLKDSLDDMTWQQANQQVDSLNTIATLVGHLTYYVRPVLNVLKGGPLVAKDSDSFELPPIQSQEDWNNLLNTSWTDANALADLIEELPEQRLWEDFTDKKYGIYYKNLHGLIEHTFYHLGQIVLLKKILTQRENS